MIAPLVALALLAAEPAPESEPLPCPTYPVELVRVIDGDTFVGRVTLPLGTERTITVRVADYDAPEVDEPGGDAATAALQRWLVTGEARIAEPTGRSFARHVARVWVGCSAGRGVPLEAAMTEAGFAKD